MKTLKKKELQSILFYKKIYNYKWKKIKKKIKKKKSLNSIQKCFYYNWININYKIWNIWLFRKDLKYLNDLKKILNIIYLKIKKLIKSEIKIIFNYDELINEKIKNDKDVLGLYYDDISDKNDIICINLENCKNKNKNKNLDTNLIKNTILHEIGHYIHNIYLNKSVIIYNKYLKKLYKNSKKNLKKYKKEYYFKNYCEYFAEGFNAFMLNAHEIRDDFPKTLKEFKTKDKKFYDFLKKDIFYSLYRKY